MKKSPRARSTTIKPPVPVPASVDDLAREAERSLPAPRGPCVASLLRMLLARTPPDRLAELPPDEIIVIASRLFELLEKPLDGFRVRLDCPKARSSKRERCALETVGADQPFILDTLLELLRVRGLEPLEVYHPIVAVTRDADGSVTSVGPPAEGSKLVSVVRLELSPRIGKEVRDGLVAEAGEVLGEARRVVEDFEPMLAKLREVEGSLRARSESSGPEQRRDLDEAAAFLDWLRRANFVFLGYRAYDIHGSGDDAVIEVRHGSGLGILRDEARSSFARPQPLSSLPPDLLERVLTPRFVLVHKTNAESRVLRRTRMDYVGEKRLSPDGRVVGEERFLGLFTARAYSDVPSDIPLLRRKLDEVLTKANVVPGSHDQRAIFSVFTSIPKHTLFVTDSDRLAEMISTIISASSQHEVRVSYRPDFLERGVSVMVLMPRDRFNPEVRPKIQKLLAEEFGGTLVDYRLALSDEPMARLHFYIATEPGKLPAPRLDELEAKVSKLVRAWDDRLREALLPVAGAAKVRRLVERYARAFPAGYLAVKSPDDAVADIELVERALFESRIQVVVGREKSAGEREVSLLKIYRPVEPFALSKLMPVLTHLGLHVLDEQTYAITPAPPKRAPRSEGEGEKQQRSPESIYLHAFHVLGPDGQPLAGGAVSVNVEETVRRALDDQVESDGLNELVPKTRLDWRQVDVLRAYDAYLHQLGEPWTRRTTYAALVEHPRAAELLVEIFEVRFDPRLSTARREESAQRLRAEFRAELERITGIVEDEVLRFFESLINASVRTTYFRRDPQGDPLPALALKLRCADVLRMPDPRPLYEIFVHSRAMEGLHVRSGKVARGGIRWSSRLDDYRMEILGLMKAQRTKNAVIVPVGAKGGFILKQAPAQPSAEEIRAAYEVLIRALLDLTDNIADGGVVHPEDVVVHDEDDPYLVVAADRGTATFSDTANAIAAERRFWLGDAFASGGSRGYDHKKEGITARGAWECVRRHFRELGIDPERQTFTAAGIGDMSGDVFGNGMIYSANTRLLAAFNHVHIFLDPDPDPRQSFEERRRLFLLPRSAWTDYDPGKLSRGGAVYRRDAKSIRLSPEAKAMLDIDRETLNGNELVRAVLRMPVDLLFNGGIGTYVKAGSESHQDVGDPANEKVRVNGAELRARIVAEGGNLGVTQLGRIEYARAGGRINTDFIDNSAGVDLSDHEVNLKILLEGALRRGALSDEERDEVLRASTPDVCAQVLRDNSLQSRVLSLEERRGVLALDEHRFLIDELVDTGLLNREVEKIPDEREILRLREARLGLTRPQLSVLLAYAKIDAYTRLLASPVVDDPELESVLVDYFPPQIRARFGEDLRRHPLRREITATAADNASINAMGIAFFHSFARRTGASFATILKALNTASVLAGAEAFHDAMDHLYAAGFSINTLYDALGRLRAAVEEILLGLLRRGIAARPTGEVLAECRRKLGSRLDGGFLARGAIIEPARSVLEPLLRHVAAAERVPEQLDVADLAGLAGMPLEVAEVAWDEAGKLLLIDRLSEEVARVPRVTAEDIQTCASLLEAARDHRRRLAARFLSRLESRKLNEAEARSALASVVPAKASARNAVSRTLETARTREPLTVSSLFVLVETLGRMAEAAGEG